MRLDRFIWQDGDFEWLDEKQEGGPGSGFFGHAGRPGKVGGSSSTGGGGGAVSQKQGGGGDASKGRISVSGYPKDAKEITPEARMAQADYADIQANMGADLRAVSKGAAKIKSVKGDLTPDNVKTIVSNAKAQLREYEGYLAGDTALKARDYIDHVGGVLSDKSLGRLDAKAVNEMMTDSVKKMVYQEIESNRQQFTDHGIRHIVGNVERADQFLMAMTDDKASGMDRLASAFTMVNHDIGYTTPLIREGGLRGVMVSGDHGKFSEKILSQQAGKWNEGRIFDRKQYDKILNITKTHDSTALDAKDPLGTAVRLSDNMSLFSKEKLPGMFKYVKGGEGHLLALGNAAKANDTVAFEKARSSLDAALDKAPLSAQLKRDLKASVREISYVTPKYTMGVLAGEMSRVRRDGGRTVVDVKYNKWDATLQKMFDMGQRQTKKLLEDYGHKDFSKTEYDLGGLVTIRVKGAPSKGA